MFIKNVLIIHEIVYIWFILKQFLFTYAQETSTFDLNIHLFFKEFAGCAIGKAKQNAITEIEKLKLNELSPEDLAKEAAKV